MELKKAQIEKLIEIEEQVEALFGDLYEGILPEEFRKAYTHLTKSKQYLTEYHNKLSGKT